MGKQTYHPAVFKPVETHNHPLRTFCELLMIYSEDYFKSDMMTLLLFLENFK